MTTTEQDAVDQPDHDESEGQASASATEETPGEAGEPGHDTGDAQRPDEAELKAVLEALLFVSHESVSLDRLASALQGVPKSEIRQALFELQQEYDRHQRGMQLVEIGGGYRFATRPEHAAWIRQLGKSKVAPKLSRSGLESLAIIAYKQPIVRAEIEQIRGVETSGVLRTLLERKLVRMVGRKDVPGRPIMYGTTKYFLQHFGLHDLSQLPPLREFKELGEAEQAMLPVGEDPVVVGGDEAVGADMSLSDSMSPEPAEQT
ncbi:MAG TPA: SMC-Scp complex subunit ScpB [Nitrospiraceae bacterium]|nr:SMC-Scp complex subunit ScpB [Nitrospiraceae bacterium]